MKIILVAGHGLSNKNAKVADVGTQAYKAAGEGTLYERDVVRKIARMTGDMTQLIPNLVCDQLGVETPLQLSKKVEVIWDQHRSTFGPVDLAIEIHLNGFANPSVYGSEVLYYDGDDKAEEYAGIFLNHILRRVSITKTRGVKGVKSGQNGAAFLGGLSRKGIPAVLTESVFMTNPATAQALRYGVLIPEIALGHASAISEIAG